MPIYNYRCTNCGTEFERLVRSDTQVACPDCQGERLERLMSLTARPAGRGQAPADYSRLGPPPGSGCCGGACHSHKH
jgi:putative FmdB family regulatory protein